MSQVQERISPSEMESMAIACLKDPSFLKEYLQQISGTVAGLVKGTGIADYQQVIARIPPEVKVRVFNQVPGITLLLSRKPKLARGLTPETIWSIFERDAEAKPIDKLTAIVAGDISPEVFDLDQLMSEVGNAEVAVIGLRAYLVKHQKTDVDTGNLKVMKPIEKVEKNQEPTAPELTYEHTDTDINTIGSRLAGTRFQLPHHLPAPKEAGFGGFVANLPMGDLKLLTIKQRGGLVSQSVYQVQDDVVTVYLYKEFNAAATVKNAILFALHEVISVAKEIGATRVVMAGSGNPGKVQDSVYGTIHLSKVNRLDI